MSRETKLVAVLCCEHPV